MKNSLNLLQLETWGCRLVRANDYACELLENIEIVGVSMDSRTVKPGDLFVAISGYQRDAAIYVGDAIKRGALAVLGHPGMAEEGKEKYWNPQFPLLIADNPRFLLSKIAAHIYPRQPECMVGVTGTAGKTSVVCFLRQIWQRAGLLAASIGTTGVSGSSRALEDKNYGNLTTPDPVALHQLLDELAGNGVTHGAMEASSHGLSQYRLDGVDLYAGAFTNLGRDHLDYHGNIEDYFSAKMRLVRELLPKSAPMIIFADDPATQRVEEIVRQAKLEPCTVGRTGHFIRLKRVEHECFRQWVELEYDGTMYRMVVPLPGEFQINNALVAAGLAIATGVRAPMVFEALEHLQGTAGRLELVGKHPSGSPVYVDYAHKPEALESVLCSLRPFTSRRLMLVFGCGGERDKGKRSLMGEIATRLADVVVVTDDNPRDESAEDIRAQILMAAPDAQEIGNRAEAIHTMVAMLEEGDCLLIAGKGHEQGQIVGSTIFPFSDQKITANALQEAKRS